MNESEKVETVVQQQTVEAPKTLSDDKKLNKKLKIIALIIIVLALLWVFVINPFITFKNNEKAFTKAAERYFDTYTSNLPTGERIGDVTLQELNEKGFIDRDYYIPYRFFSKKTCSVTDSWVKVKKVDDDYKYYTYLKCGILSSNVDHKGPKITLNGKEEVTISLNEKYKDAGIKSINDNTDGKIDVSKATVKDNVDTTKIGQYKVTYTVIDSLKNKTVVTRTVNVVQKLNSTVKQDTNNTGSFTGYPSNNYIYFSGMLFRIVDLDGDNVRIVAAYDVANVNHDGIEEWLKYYYDHITNEAKKLVVKNKYCNMTVKEKDTNTTECSSYTKAREVYIPSIVDVNKAEENGKNFLKPYTITWLADSANENKSYSTRISFSGEYIDQDYLLLDNSYNVGVRPMLTIKGDTLIQKGSGTINDPYVLGEFELGKADDKVNTRHSGEYINIDGQNWIIVDPQSDGTTKIIAEEALKDSDGYLLLKATNDNTYNPTEKDNIGYKINNQSSKYLNTKYFVKHEIEVPIYKKEVSYKGESKVEKFKTMISAPNMYEMYSANGTVISGGSYWLINSTKLENTYYGVSGTGVVMHGEIMGAASEFGVKPVAFLNKNCIIVDGSGTENDPYTISK